MMCMLLDGVQHLANHSYFSYRACLTMSYSIFLATLWRIDFEIFFKSCAILIYVKLQMMFRTRQTKNNLFFYL